MNSLKNICLRSLRHYSEGFPKTAAQAVNDNVPGLSTKVLSTPSGPVGPSVDPGKSGAYKVPEYFCYNNMSYFEAEVEMSKFRLPQPSALKK